MKSKKNWTSLIFSILFLIQSCFNLLKGLYLDFFILLLFSIAMLLLFFLLNKKA